VGDRRVVDAVADRRSQVSPPPATLPSLQGLVRLGLARLGSIFFPGRWGASFLPGRRRVEKTRKGLISKWVRHKRTPVYELARLFSRPNLSGWLGRLPGPEWRNRMRPYRIQVEMIAGN
jgi:hypothetical protein